jgi:ADP-ribose pyrophosphatase YjhB (NUDIX family)
MNKIICSGALFYSLATERFLLLYRNKNSSRSNCWGLVGGKNEGSETPWEGLQREIEEEIGVVKIKKTIPLESFVSSDEHFSFHTYLCLVDNEFIPQLNEEHSGYSWCSFNQWPKPLHTGLANTLRSKTNKNKLETVTQVAHLIS